MIGRIASVAALIVAGVVWCPVYLVMGIKKVEVENEEF